MESGEAGVWVQNPGPEALPVPRSSNPQPSALKLQTLLPPLAAIPSASQPLPFLLICALATLLGSLSFPLAALREQGDTFLDPLLSHPLAWALKTLPQAQHPTQALSSPPATSSGEGQIWGTGARQE